MEGHLNNLFGPIKVVLRGGLPAGCRLRTRPEQRNIPGDSDCSAARWKIPLLVAILVLSVIMSSCTRDSADQSRSPQDDKDQPEAAAGITEQTPDLVSIRLPMGYIPDPQYAPFYVAAKKGYFAEEGLVIEFDYSFETDGIALVGAGELPLAVVSGEQVLLARAQNLPVVYVLEWFQRFPIAVVSKIDKGIQEPADLTGHTVGLPGFFGASYVGFMGLLAANQLSEDDVILADIGFTQVESLLADQVDAVVGYVNNEPLQLASRGEAVNVILVSDSTDMVANGIITNEDTISQNPELVTGFVRALLRGLADTLADPDQAFEISKGYVEALDDSRRNVLDASLPLWQSESLGITEAESWLNTQQVLVDIGFLDEPLSDLEAAFTNRFVEEAQP